MVPRIVTVCIEGENIDSTRKNKKRENILLDVAKKISKKWENIDAVVFPGGYFFLNWYIGDMEFSDRKRVLEKASFHKVCIKACKMFRGKTLFVVGVDSKRPPRSRREIGWQLGDQLAIAWSKNGIGCIGRKIFPVYGNESKHYLCYKDDFSTKKRILRLKNGEKAVLCVCYDMFGCSENYNHYKKRTTYIKHISNEENIENMRKKYVENFIHLLKTEKITVGIVTIHNNPTRYWQCHGIDTCSASLGGLAIGASHFSKLPSWDKMILASNKASKKILRLKDKRKRVGLDNTYKPKDFIKNDKYLVRVFEL